jgi:hypothetical protein
MAKPDPEEFARKLLWHISGLRAEVRNLHMMFARFLAAESGHSEEEVQTKWKSDSEAQQKELYLQALEEIGIPPESPPPSDLKGDKRI